MPSPLEPADTGPAPAFAPRPSALALAVAGAAMGGGRAAAATEISRRSGPWIECRFVDSAGLPLAGLPYLLTLPDGTTSAGTLCRDGAIRRDLPAAGRYELVLMDVHSAAWGLASAGVGERVQLSASAAGFVDGEPAVLVIFRRSVRDADETVAVIDAEVRGGRVESEWALEATAAPTTEPSDDHRLSVTDEFYFEVTVGECAARSDTLTITGDLSIEQPASAGSTYLAVLPDGRARTGRLDAAGRAVERGVPPGYARVLITGR